MSTSKELSSSCGSTPTPEKSVVVAYACDVEGNFEYWSRYIEISEVLRRLPTGELELNKDSYFVFGGDVVDRGTGDLRVLTDLVGLRRAYPDRVFFIMGNRDINKMRLPVELHKSSLFVSPRVYWVKPEEDVRDYLQDPSNQVDRLKWMLTKTMGSPLAFEYRRDELKLLNSSSSGYGDDDVVESFIDLMRPDGLMMEYLKCANIAVILGDTLFIHGGIQTYNMGWLPPMKVFDMTTTPSSARNLYTNSSSSSSSQRNSDVRVTIDSPSFSSSSSSSSSSSMKSHRNDSHQSLTAAAEEGGGVSLSQKQSLSRVFAFGSFDETVTAAAADVGVRNVDDSTDFSPRKGVASLKDFHAKIHDPMQPLQQPLSPSSSSSSSSPPVLPLRAWVEAVNRFALEEVVDFAEHIGAYIEAADAELSLTDVKEKKQCSSSSGSDSLGTVRGGAGGSDRCCVDICRESISWAAVGGYDHPQPGSRLMQYAMGWMPDKSVNPSVIYAEGLTKATSSYNANESTKPVPEPSLEVARYLKEGLVNKVIVGHQPRGDAPLILDLGTGVQVISADTSYAANTLWDMHNTGEWSSLPQRRSASSTIRGGGSQSTANSMNSTQANSRATTPRPSFLFSAALGRRNPQSMPVPLGGHGPDQNRLGASAVGEAKSSRLFSGGQVNGGGYGDMGRLPRAHSPAREAIAMPPLDFSSLTVSQKQQLTAQMVAGGRAGEDEAIRTARAALEAESPRRASLIMTQTAVAAAIDSLNLDNISPRRSSDPLLSSSASAALLSVDGSGSQTPTKRRQSSGLNMLASISAQSDLALLTSTSVGASTCATPFDTARKDEKKQKSLWSLVKNSLRVTAALRSGVNTGNNSARSNESQSPRTSDHPASVNPPLTDSSNTSDRELRQSSSSSTTSHPAAAAAAASVVDGSLVLQSTANSSIASSARSHVSECIVEEDEDGVPLTARQHCSHQRVEEIVPLMWLRGKPQEENSRGIAVANLLLRMSSGSLTLRSTPVAASAAFGSSSSSTPRRALISSAALDAEQPTVVGGDDSLLRGNLTWSAWAGWDVDLSVNSQNKDQAVAPTAGLTSSASSEQLHKEPSAARKLIGRSDCKSESAIYTGNSPMPSPGASAVAVTRVGDDVDDENFEASDRMDRSQQQRLSVASIDKLRIDLGDCSIPRSMQQRPASSSAATAASSSSLTRGHALPSSLNNKSPRIAFSSSSKVDGGSSNDNSGREFNGTWTPSTQANTDVETKSRANSISTFVSKCPSVDADDNNNSSSSSSRSNNAVETIPAKEAVLAMLNDDVVDDGDGDFIAMDTRHVSKAVVNIFQSAATADAAAVEAQDTSGVSVFTATEAERLQMFGQLFKSASSMQRSNVPKASSKRQRSAFGGSFQVTSSTVLHQDRSLTSNTTAAASLPMDGQRIMRTLSAGNDGDNDNGVDTPRTPRTPRASVMAPLQRAKSLRSGGLEESSFSSSSSMRRSTSAGNLAAMVESSHGQSVNGPSPLFRQSSAMKPDGLSMAMIRRLDSNNNNSFHSGKSGTAVTDASVAVPLEYPEPAPAVSQLTIYGTLSQGIEYKFELHPPKANPFIGKKTRDGWFVKARGIFLNADEEAEVLAQAKSELLLYQQKHQEESAMNSLLPFLSMASNGTSVATADVVTTPTSRKGRRTGSQNNVPADSFSMPAEARARTGSFVLSSSSKDDLAAAVLGSSSPAVDDVIDVANQVQASFGAVSGPATVCFAPDQYLDDCNSSSSIDPRGCYDDQVHPDSLYLITLTAGFAVKNRVVTEEILRFMMDLSLED